MHDFDARLNRVLLEWNFGRREANRDAPPPAAADASQSTPASDQPARDARAVVAKLERAVARLPAQTRTMMSPEMFASIVRAMPDVAAFLRQPANAGVMRALMSKYMTQGGATGREGYPARDRFSRRPPQGS